MKTCSRCGEVKQESEFAFKSRAKNLLHVWCKVCQKVYKDKHYIDNKADYIRRVGIRNRRVKDELNIRLIEYLKTHPCVDCGESNHVVLQFDHVRGQKKNAISYMVSNGFSWSVIFEEIKKCAVRCANCHMIKTAKQFGWYKNLGSSPNWDGISPAPRNNVGSTPIDSTNFIRASASVNEG